LDEDSDRPIAAEMARIFASMAFADAAANPSSLVERMPFSGQQDAVECIDWLFDQIGGAEQENSAVQRAFGLRLVTTVRCSSCGSRCTSKAFEHGLRLAPAGTETSVQALLDEHVRDEACPGYRCDACGEVGSSHKEVTVESHPPNLIVTVGRYQYDAQLGFQKWRGQLEVNDAVTLDSVEYRLYAVVVHHGATPHSGHYTAVGHRSRGGAPNYFDDANVSAVKALPQMGQDAYVLLYTRGDEVPVKCPRRLLAQAFIECATR
jgi:ubiquitin C-terminal hydrolase